MQFGTTGGIRTLEVIDTLFAEELSLRENRRVKMALRMAKLSTVKTLTGFDFSFQPSLDRNRILALAQLDFIEHNEVIHFLGPPGTGKSHLATRRCGLCWSACRAMGAICSD
jgi:DNA replication protein DnaC